MKTKFLHYLVHLANYHLKEGLLIVVNIKPLLEIVVLDVNDSKNVFVIVYYVYVVYLW